MELLKMLSFWVSCLFIVIGAAHGLRSPTVKLSDGNEMPIVGFGTHFRTPTQEEKALLNALQVGYRHFDTAHIYRNEKTVGNTFKKWFAQGGKREELFITTKLPPEAMRPEDVNTYLTASLENLGLDYIDMYLIHLPFGFKHIDDMSLSTFDVYQIDPTTDYLPVWKEMEKLVKSGRVKSIGLSNFNVSQVLDVYNHAEIKPANLQIELNLYFQQEELRNLCKELNIAVTAYSPLGSNDLIHLRRRREAGRKTLVPLMKHPLLLELAEKYDKSTAQIMLRYMVQNGIIVIPKSGNPGRMTDNLNIFDFSLTQEDMAQLKTLDQHGKVRKFDFLSFIGAGKHPQYPFSDKVQ